MKKLTLTFRLIALLLRSSLVVSCGDDDEEELRTLENQLEYDNTVYELTLGATLDLGPAGFETTETHYGQAFLLSDANMATGAETVNLVFYAFSLGNNIFKTGTFEYANLSGLTNAQQQAAYGNKNFFFNSSLVFDLNDDKELDYTNETVEITSGTVTISGTSPNYTMDCDVVLENGKRVRAQYTGNFFQVPVTDIDEDATAASQKVPSSVFNLSIPKELKVK